MLATADPGQIPPDLHLESFPLELQSAAPDLRIRMDAYLPPAHSVRSNPDELVSVASREASIKSAIWSTPTPTFPNGAEWEVNAENAESWASHQFEGHFSERVLRLMGNPEGHPLFELRLDLLEYEQLFARFIASRRGNGSSSCRWEMDPEHWGRTLVPSERFPNRSRSLGIPTDDPHLVRVELGAQPWTPRCPELFTCLQLSCRNYAAGLARYLLPGREHWGGD